MKKLENVRTIGAPASKPRLPRLLSAHDLPGIVGGGDAVSTVKLPQG